MKKLLVLFVLILSGMSNHLLAQDVAMADGMRAEGKIYVVVAIVLLILVAIFAFLFRLDRKISKLESELSDSSDQVQK